jgi:hypothetical protein
MNNLQISKKLSFQNFSLFVLFSLERFRIDGPPLGQNGGHLRESTINFVPGFFKKVAKKYNATEVGPQFQNREINSGGNKFTKS